MRVPNQRDDETAKLIYFLIKNGRLDKLRQMIKTNAGNADKTADLCFHQSLFAIGLMNHTDNAREKYKMLVEAMDSCGLAIGMQPDFWAALYYRSMVRTMLSGKQQEDEYSFATIEYSIEAAELDCLKMLALQKNEPDNPYNIMTYAILAYSNLCQGKNDAAQDYLNTGFETTPAWEIKYLASEFKLPLKKLWNQLMLLGLTDPAKRLAARIKVQFPATMAKLGHG